MSELEERLAAAEQVCILYGWTGSLAGRSERDDAVTQAWMDWFKKYGERYHDVRSKYPEWQQRITELSQRRRQTRSETLARIRGEAQ